MDRSGWMLVVAAVAVVFAVVSFTIVRTSSTPTHAPTTPAPMTTLPAGVAGVGGRPPAPTTWRPRPQATTQPPRRPAVRTTQATGTPTGYPNTPSPTGRLSGTTVAPTPGTTTAPTPSPQTANTPNPTPLGEHTGGSS